MAGHIQDRWYKTESDANGKARRVKTDRHGTGMRYRARYIGPDGTERSKSFPDRQKRLAEQWLTNIEADMSRGQYIDPAAGRTTFQQYAERWLDGYQADRNTVLAMESRLRLHAFPFIGTRPLGSFKPEHVRDWLAELDNRGVVGSYAKVIYSTVRTVLSAAVDDGHLVKHPCAARSVRAPATERQRVIPWSAERVFAVRRSLPARFAAMVDAGAGCGLRQGEILGLAVDAVDFSAGTLHVVRQLKLSGTRPIFAPPKGGRLRDVPLPAPVAAALKEHMKRYPPVAVTLPWGTVKGPQVTHRVVFTAPGGNHVWRSTFNTEAWKPALVAAGIISEREPGARSHASARSDGMHALRHFYASVLLDAGENIKAVAEYLGHADPGLTLRVYAHLMPTSRERTQRAVSAVYSDGPGTAQERQCEAGAGD
ncbi:tyrosine-type recombinase/integrase [Streptomyces albidoflavus]|uniref:tyrosine-type recombinase/integrase n=1 Tax=Streptomyces albidoflavus TaxID=1886 RepID=UPI0033A2C29F